MTEMDENVIRIDDSREILEERIELAADRIAELPGEPAEDWAAEYFGVLKDFLLLCLREYREKRCDRETNAALYRCMREEDYEGSWLDPAYAVKRAGETGQLLSVWYGECISLIPAIYEGKLEEIAAVLETTVQIYNIFEWNDINDKASAVRDVIYEYLYDYAPLMAGGYLAASNDPGDHFAYDIVMGADLTDTSEHSYLYRFGEWITEEELASARRMNALPEDTVVRMARAYTEGYIRGFAMTGKDVTKKSSVSCFLPLGFERFMREAVRQFEAAGLKVVLSRGPRHLISRRLGGNVQPGFYGAFNDRCLHDHSEDMALFWGDKLRACKLQAMSNACEEHKDLLSAMSGRACVEIFGLLSETPAHKPESPSYSEHQLEVNREYQLQYHELLQKYMPDEETSFTIIAWPTVSIADRLATESGRDREEVYGEIFDAFVGINTLPTGRWQEIQQCLTDALDRAGRVEIRGAGSNETELTVRLHTLADPDRETNFENCLADVNIPAGEVFTSPLLAGTDGLLHVGHVYIGGVLFRDLKISFRDGRVQDYGCGGFADPEEGRRMIRKIIFRDREMLPMGEFAIGTNTIAYSTARRYRIEEKMPILIAEKTGPHFAVGDTCYSYEEEIETFNPDGKKIIARENECSALRHTAPDKAYFSVHTDITLPYDELGRITAVRGQERTDILRDGRFVLPGTEELNEALE